MARFRGKVGDVLRARGGRRRRALESMVVDLCVVEGDAFWVGWSLLRGGNW